MGAQGIPVVLIRQHQRRDTTLCLDGHGASGQQDQGEKQQPAFHHRESDRLCRFHNVISAYLDYIRTLRIRKQPQTSRWPFSGELDGRAQLADHYSDDLHLYANHSTQFGSRRGLHLRLRRAIDAAQLGWWCLGSTPLLVVLGLQVLAVPVWQTKRPSRSPSVYSFTTILSPSLAKLTVPSKSVRCHPAAPTWAFHASSTPAARSR